MGQTGKKGRAICAVFMACAADAFFVHRRLTESNLVDHPPFTHRYLNSVTRRRQRPLPLAFDRPLRIGHFEWTVHRACFHLACFVDILGPGDIELYWMSGREK